MATEPELDLFEKFKSSVIKSMKTPIPKTVKRKLHRKRSSEEIEVDDGDTDDAIHSDDDHLFASWTEPPHKRHRSTSNHDDSEDADDEEFDELFDIEQSQSNNTNNTSSTDNKRDNAVSRKPRRRRYFDVLNEEKNDEENSNKNKEENEEEEEEGNDKASENGVNHGHTEILHKIKTRPDNNINFKCYNCSEVGHIARNCPHDPIEICFKCGNVGHTGFYCPNGICSFCLGNHPMYECKLFTVNKDTFRFCIRCGSKDHYFNKCDEELSLRMVQLQCFVCGKYGHLNCKSMQENDRSLDDSYSYDTYSNSKSKHNRHHHHHHKNGKRVTMCSNCGDKRHTVYFCKHFRMSKSEIAIGLSTAANEPKVCYFCLCSDHNARNCPIVIRQKQQRQKVKGMKRGQTNYSSNDDKTCTPKSRNDKDMKRKKFDFSKQRAQILQSQS